MALVFSLLSGVILFAQAPAEENDLQKASAAYQTGRHSKAEQILNNVLKSHPTDSHALILMGIVLDAEHRYSDAEPYYQRALKIAPVSPQVLNNAGNHYLAIGNRARAREFYLKAIQADPQHPNANLQLAQMSVEDKQGPQALAYLSRVGDALKSDPAGRLLWSRALALSGQCADAAEILKKFDVRDGGDAPLYFSVGMAQAECKLYASAEASFSYALDVDPRNYAILYNLGLAALRADHAERAQDVLETALKERPGDPDALFALSQVHLEQKRPFEAAEALAKAQKVAPERADILLLMARVSGQLEFYEDSAASYDRYLRLKPDDDTARRERGFAYAQANQSRKALPDLQWYTSGHPRDAVGFYELAVAEYLDQRSRSLQSLERALALDPAMIQAHYSRAVLRIEDGNPAAAVDDLRFILEREPNNYSVLARLGQAYLAMYRADDALEVLKRAVELAPKALFPLIQYRRALEQAGRTQEAAEILTRLKQSGVAANGLKPQAGLIEYLSLPAADQRARYLSNLRKEVEGNPDDFRLRIRLGSELLASGKIAEGLAVFTAVRTSDEPEILARCGRILVEYEQYAPARQFLEPALAVTTAPAILRLDLAIVLFHLQGAEAALAELDKTPVAERQGDYYLLRAQFLDAQGKTEGAVEALNRGIRAAPTRASLYLQAAGFLLKHKLNHEAEDLLAQASRVLPDDRELLLARVVTLELLRRELDAQKLLANIQTRWPEWNRPYLLNGILLEIQLKSAEARQTLETAIALGAETAEAYYYLALAILHSAPEALDSSQNAINQALRLASTDPYMYLLAGKIALARKDYRAAIGRLSEAARLHPALIPAHYALRDAYKAAGDEQKSAAELETIKQIASQGDVSEQSPISLGDFLFTVRPPG